MAGRRTKVSQEYLVHPIQGEDGSWYAATMFTTEGADGSPVQTVKIWGSLTEDLTFVPGEEFKKASPEELAKLIFPENVNMEGVEGWEELKGKTKRSLKNGLRRKKSEAAGADEENKPIDQEKTPRKRRTTQKEPTEVNPLETEDPALGEAKASGEVKKQEQKKTPVKKSQKVAPGEDTEDKEGEEEPPVESKGRAKTSRKKKAEEKTEEEVPEEVVLEEAASEEAVSEEMSSEEGALEEAVSEEVSSEEEVSEQVPLEEPDADRDFEASEVTKSASEPSRQVETELLEEAAKEEEETPEGEEAEEEREPEAVEAQELEPEESLERKEAEPEESLEKKEADPEIILEEPDFVQGLETGEVTSTALEESQQVETGFLEEQSQPEEDLDPEETLESSADNTREAEATIEATEEDLEEEIEEEVYQEQEEVKEEIEEEAYQEQEEVKEEIEEEAEQALEEVLETASLEEEADIAGGLEAGEATKAPLEACFQVEAGFPEEEETPKEAKKHQEEDAQQETEVNQGEGNPEEKEEKVDESVVKDSDKDMNLGEQEEAFEGKKKKRKNSEDGGEDPSSNAQGAGAGEEKEAPVGKKKKPFKKKDKAARTEKGPREAAGEEETEPEGGMGFLEPEEEDSPLEGKDKKKGHGKKGYSKNGKVQGGMYEEVSPEETFGELEDEQKGEKTESLEKGLEEGEREPEENGNPFKKKKKKFKNGRAREAFERDAKEKEDSFDSFQEPEQEDLEFYQEDEPLCKDEEDSHPGGKQAAREAEEEALENPEEEEAFQAQMEPQQGRYSGRRSQYGGRERQPARGADAREDARGTRPTEPGSGEAGPREGASRESTPVQIDWLGVNQQKNNRLYGDVWLLTQIASKLGIYQDLLEAFQRDGGFVADLLTISVYPYLTGMPLERLLSWQNTSKTPSETQLSPSAIRRILTKAGDVGVGRYAKAHVRRGGDTQYVLLSCSMDRANLETSSGNALLFPWEKRESAAVPSPQTILYHGEKNAPLAYCFEGREEGSVALYEAALSALDKEDRSSLLYVDEQGMLCQEQIGEMVVKEIPYLTRVEPTFAPVLEVLKGLPYDNGVPLSLSYDKERSLFYGKVILPGFAIYTEEDEKAEVYNAYGYLFCNMEARSQELMKLARDIRTEKTLLEEFRTRRVTALDVKELKESLKYHKLSSEKNGMVTISEKKEKLAKLRSIAGFVTLLSVGKDLDPWKALSYYQLIKKQSAYLNDILPLGESILEEDAQNGWGFAASLGYEVALELEKVWAGTELKKRYESPIHVLDEMRAIRLVELPEKGALTTQLTPSQALICSAFDLSAPGATARPNYHGYRRRRTR